MKTFAENLFRGPKVDAGFLDIQGIKATLDLESGTQVLGDDLPLDEAVEEEQHGVRVYSCPLGGFFPPSLRELRAAVAFLVNQQKLGIRTYLHCKHGVDRTGMVVAAYRIIAEGKTPQQAADECLAEGMHEIYVLWLIQLWRL